MTLELPPSTDPASVSALAARMADVASGLSDQEQGMAEVLASLPKDVAHHGVDAHARVVTLQARTRRAATLASGVAGALQEHAVALHEVQAITRRARELDVSPASADPATAFEARRLAHVALQRHDEAVRRLASSLAVARQALPRH